MSQATGRHVTVDSGCAYYISHHVTAFITLLYDPLPLLYTKYMYIGLQPCMYVLNIDEYPCIRDDMDAQVFPIIEQYNQQSFHVYENRPIRLQVFLNMSRCVALPREAPYQ